MAKSCFKNHTQASTTLHPFVLPILTSFIQIIFYTLFYNIFIHLRAIPIEPTDTDSYFPPDDPYRFSLRL